MGVCVHKTAKVEKNKKQAINNSNFNSNLNKKEAENISKELFKDMIEWEGKIK